MKTSRAFFGICFFLITLTALPLSATTPLKVSLYSTFAGPLSFSAGAVQLGKDLFYFRKNAEENKAILPKKTLGELGRLLIDADGEISYERGENHMFFDVGGRTLISRMIDGQFPAYERVIPKGNDKRIEFERDRLTNAVKRVALLSNERSRAVKFQIDKGKVDVTSSSPEIGEAHETLPVDYAGSAMQICFNAQYVLDFLSAVTCDVVALELKDEVSQVVMAPVGADGYEYTYVIMPMRV